MRSLQLFLISLLLVIGLVACSKVNQENFDQIETDMTRAQVHEILGKPDEVNSSSIGALSFSSETWLGRDHTISIQYANGKVKLKNISATTKE